MKIFNSFDKYLTISLSSFLTQFFLSIINYIDVIRCTCKIYECKMITLSILIKNYLLKLFIDIDTQSINPEIRSNPNPEIEWTIYDLLGRIVNGSKATLRQFPYQVRVL